MKNLLSEIICGSNKDMIRLCLKGAKIQRYHYDDIICKNGIEIRNCNGQGEIYLEEAEEYMYSRLSFDELMAFCKPPEVKASLSKKVFDAVKGAFK